MAHVFNKGKGKRPSVKNTFLSKLPKEDKVVLSKAFDEFGIEMAAAVEKFSASTISVDDRNWLSLRGGIVAAVKQVVRDFTQTAKELK